MGDGRVEGSSAIEDGGQAVVSLTSDIDGTGSCSLMDSVLPLKKNDSVMSGSIFFSHRK